MRKAVLAAALALLTGQAFAQCIGFQCPDQDMGRRGGGVPPALDYIFSSGSYSQPAVPGCVSAATCITVARASSGTNLLPVSAAGASFTTFGNNVARITSGFGLLIEEARTNRLLNSTAPATQTTASINCSASCTLWVNGAGSALASAGTATGCSGFSPATNGTSNTFVCTGAGTVTVTVTGALSAFQLENGIFPTSLIVTAGATVARVADVVTVTTAPTFSAQYSFRGTIIPYAPVTYANSQYLVNLDIGATTDRTLVFRTLATGAIFMQNVIAGVSQTGRSDGVLTAGVSNTFVGATRSGLQLIGTNGVTQSSTSLQSSSVPTRIVIGSNGAGAGLMDGYMSRLTVWPGTFVGFSPP